MIIVSTDENENGLSVVPGIANQNGNGNIVATRVEGNGNGNNENEIRGYKCQGVDHYARNCTVKPRKKEAAHLKTQLQIAQKEEAGIQLNSEEFDFIVAAGAYDEIEEVNANCTLTDNLQQASTSGTQTDSAPVYDSDGSAEVYHAKNCYDNDIFNIFTQVEHYTELLEPISEPHQVQQNDINVIFVVSSAEQSGGTVEQNSTTVEETCVYFESLYNNLAIEVEKVNTVNCKMKETNADLTIGLARYKNQEKCFEINPEKYDKLEREAAKFVRDFKSLAKETDESLDKIKVLEYDNDRILRAVILKRWQSAPASVLGLKRLQGFLEVTTAQVLRNRSRIGINKWYQSFALRNFDLEDKEFESTNSNTTAKLPILKLVTKMSIPVTAEEKINKKNDVKAKSLLLMALPNEYQLTFSQYPDAKTMFAAIKTRFGGNAATQKTQKTLLKQQYENFSASSAESLDSIFNRLQKIVSRLAILGVVIAQEDLNSKFLSSLPPEWNTHVAVWMNKLEIEMISIVDLYNNFKIVEQKVKKPVGASSGAQNLAFMTAPSTSSTNDANTASPQNPNGSNLLHQDLEQNHEDDLEAMDLKWQLSLLSMREKMYYQRTGKKIFVNANDTAGYDKSKVECFNCHKMGHFARECRAPRSKEGFNWSDMAEEQVQTNIALMAFLDSELNQTEFTAATYKRGLAIVEEQVITYRKNEVLFNEEVTVLKREVACKDYEINVLKSEFEKVKQEIEGSKFKIEKFDKASKDLDKLLESQITDKSKKGLGYSAVPPPHHLIYNRPKKLDLFYSSLNEFKEPEFKGYGSEVSKKESNVVCDKKLDDSKQNSDNSLGKPQQDDTGFVDSGCSRHMTGNIAYLSDFKEFDGGYVTFGGGAHGGRISSKGTLKTDSIDFEDVYFVNELKFNLFSVSQMCDKNNYVLFTDTEWKQYRASCKSKVPNPITKPLFMLHMDLFGPTFVSSLMHKKYCLVVTNDYNRFTWFFFLTTKDETSEILKNFVKEIENLVNKKVKIIRSDNGTEFKNKVMDDFCKEKCIKREYSIARTPQQNGVAERRNRTLIEAARTMLADSKLPTTFWAKVISTVCYVQNKVLVVKPHNKTPYELFRGFKLALSFMKPFGCHVTILNTLDSLGKFDGQSDEDFFVRYSLSSKAFRVYNTRTRRVEKNLHIGFLENKPMIEGNGPKWMFDIDSLTQSMNYVPVAAGTIINESVGTQEELNAGTSEEIIQDCIVMPIWKDASYFDSPIKDVDNGEPKSAADDQNPKEVNAAGQHVNTASPDVTIGSFKLNTVNPSVNTASSYDQDNPKDMFTMGASHTLEATHVEFFNDENEPKVDLGNITNSYIVSTTPNTRIYKDHPIENVIGDVKTSVQTRRMTKPNSEQGFLSAVHRREEGIDYEEVFAPVARIEAIRLFLAYASFMGFLVYQMDMKSAFLYETIKEEVYVTQPPGFKDPDHPNKLYKVVKALYGLHQAPRAWYETLANYLLGNGFKRGKIDQTLFIKKQKGDILLVYVYVDDIIFGSTNKELCTGFEKLMKDKFQMSSIRELTFFLGLQVQQKEEGIFISQDKYVAEILKKFNYTDVKSASTLVDLEKPLVKDGDADDVDVHLYRSMIGSLMYLTASRPDIIYLKGKPTLGLWYSRDSPFELVAYTDSDYAGATQDRKSTTGGYLLTKGFDAGRFQYLVSSISKEVGKPRYLNLVVPLKKVGDEVVHKELGDRMERVATTASSLEVEQGSGSGPRCQDTILGDVDAQTRFETTSKQSNNPPFLRGYTLRSREDSMKLLELMELCAKLLKMLHKNRKSVLATAKANTINGERQLQALIDKKKVIITESSIRSDLHLEDARGTDCLPTATIFEELARMGSQKKQSRRKQRKDTIVTQEEIQQDDSVPTPSNDPPLSGKDSMQLSKLMVLCTNLQKQVLDLEKAKDAQAKKIDDLKKRVQKLERKKKSRTT
ncbi:putative ribonuclease H-like domain-containing protein [Tanacetum coccineum]